MPSLIAVREDGEFNSNKDFSACSALSKRRLISSFKICTSSREIKKKRKKEKKKKRKKEKKKKIEKEMEY